MGQARDRPAIGWLGLGGMVLTACTAGSAIAPRTLDAPMAYDLDQVAFEASLVVEGPIVEARTDGIEAAGALASTLPEVGELEAGPGCALVFAGCTTFTDRTAPDADRTVYFQNYSYDPQCLMIRSGQTVTFAGDFIVHPLTPACGPELVLYYRDTGATASFNLTVTGVYGYYCLDHGNPEGAAMSGAIMVVP
jgi:plastocyanin